MRVAGVDEAGRGCVIGPLVVAGALFDEDAIPLLAEMGVRDSKRLTKKKRVSLDEQIKALAINYHYFEISPKVIDRVVFRGQPLRRLNYLETMVMAYVLRKLKPDKAYVDTCDVDSNRVARQIRSVIAFDVDITCEPKADDRYPVTSAASILAKVRRDTVIDELKKKYGDFNSGYASDKKTQAFIDEWFKHNKECPCFIRKSWATTQRRLGSRKTEQQP
jgi:ribonuclease HII